MKKAFFFAAVMTVIAGTASAQPVYRCGSDYTNMPCSEGRLVDTRNSATAAQRAEAQRVYERERLFAIRLVHERRTAEREHKPALAGNIGPTKGVGLEATSSAKKRKKPKHRPRLSEDSDFIARVPKTTLAAR